ncbi:Hypothetical Protein FCC1311_004092 [Hondaea fermentalgiana]|uniref:Uncharacterized protein n=1 Tax=Hondaea fermentalgiana TaxID=2315210 RepID=A0A2R5G826_9STRA|nr:Hypothetical Protein FCC1311_004092 [Hondaea fermentalgiana]|eukprot:GBG24191.1 Hypothetical Protein FCC1311_004092 [Hondaea fermentalgiana]
MLASCELDVSTSSHAARGRALEGRDGDRDAEENAEDEVRAALEDVETEADEDEDDDEESPPSSPADAAPGPQEEEPVNLMISWCLCGRCGGTAEAYWTLAAVAAGGMAPEAWKLGELWATAGDYEGLERHRISRSAKDPTSPDLAFLTLASTETKSSSSSSSYYYYYFYFYFMMEKATPISGKIFGQAVEANVDGGYVIPNKEFNQSVQARRLQMARDAIDEPRNGGGDPRKFAKILHCTALSIGEESLDERHPNVASTLNIIA